MDGIDIVYTFAKNWELHINNIRYNMIEYTKERPLRVVTLFSGYDSQCLALNRLKDVYHDFDYELVAWSEFDPESKTPTPYQAAQKAHNALFPQWSGRNLGDITKVDVNSVPDCDLMTWSFPCTDVSQAGKQEGLKDGSGTRSSLVWDAMRIFRAKKPRFLLMENVSNLASRKFIKDFYNILSMLEEIGYANFSQVLDAKDYGVPQHRERLFMVSVLRTDDVPDPTFHFPAPFPLQRSLKDVVDDDVDERYYFSDEKVMQYMEALHETD